MRPLLTMSEPDLTHALMQIPRTDAPDAVRIALEMLATELDAQRAEPTREPGEAALSHAPQDAAGTHLEGGKIGQWPTGVVVDAATIRRQAIEECIAEIPTNAGTMEFRLVWAALRNRLEALRDPADAREEGKR